MAKKQTNKSNDENDTPLNWEWKANPDSLRKFYVVFGCKSVPCMAMNEEDAALRVLTNMVKDAMRKQMENQSENNNSMGGMEVPADLAVSESGPYSPSDITDDFKKGDYAPLDYKEIKALWNKGHDNDKMFKVPELLPKIAERLKNEMGDSFTDEGFGFDDDACGS